jgi:hypothetical protein
VHEHLLAIHNHNWGLDLALRARPKRKLDFNWLMVETSLKHEAEVGYVLNLASPLKCGGTPQFDRWRDVEC